VSRAGKLHLMSVHAQSVHMLLTAYHCWLLVSPKTSQGVNHYHLFQLTQPVHHQSTNIESQEISPTVSKRNWPRILAIKN